MALTSWMKFRFFNVSQVRFQDPPDSSPFTDNVSSICTGSDNVFLGGHDGTVRIVSRVFKVIRSFQAHETGSITHMKQVEGTALLVTVAEDLSNEPTLKVWSLDKIEKKTGSPRCQSTLSIQNGRKQFPVSAFAALEDLSQVAVGFANGAVTVIRGDLVHDRGTKQRIVFESEEPITGIQFREGNTTALYIATTSRVLTLVIAGRGQGQPARILDERGCALGCMTVDWNTRDIIVARDDAIYYYGLYGRGACYNFDGEKSLATGHRDYVAIVSPNVTTKSTSKTSFALATSGPSNNVSQSSTLVILDTDFQFVAHTETLSSGAKQCFTEWGDLFILTADGSLFRYREKTLHERFEILFQRNLYVLAIQIAQKAGVDAAQQNDIFRRYGDHLYQNKDYEPAMEQYLKAIDNTEPSQIIRKYLDTQRIHSLIQYLEELHEHHKVTSDHTILLLNCYAKLKDVDKLEAFIKAHGKETFDFDTAILMCRQAGYFDQAAYLARKHSEHDLVVSILIEDSRKYAEALAYIWRLEPASASKNLLKYGTVLLEHCSGDTTDLFIDYYTGKFRPKKDAVVVTTVPSTQTTRFTTSAVQNLASLLPLPYMTIEPIEQPNLSDQKTQTRVVESQPDSAPIEYEVPRPREAFSSFLDHQDEFIKFLEACIAAETLREEDKPDVYSTLFEMYLRKANDSSSADRGSWEASATQLLERKDVPLDTLNVLLLSDLERFQDGAVLVREQQDLRFDVFRAYASASDTAGVIKALKKYGPNEPRLYPAALAYFTSSPRALEEAGSEFDAVLRRIDEERLLAPLQVVQILSTNAVATMGLVKDYLQNTIGRERDEIAKNRKMTATFRADSIAKRQELEKLESEPQTLKATRCAACGYPLDPPSVHYMCEHSYHQRCLNVSEEDPVDTVECPRCAPQNANIRAIKKAQDESRESHDLFKEQLSRSKDRFSTVADFFGRGAFSGLNGE